MMNKELLVKQANPLFSAVMYFLPPFDDFSYHFAIESQNRIKGTSAMMRMLIEVKEYVIIDGSTPTKLSTDTATLNLLLLQSKS